jgi:hypothetical protein
MAIAPTSAETVQADAAWYRTAAAARPGAAGPATATGQDGAAKARPGAGGTATPTGPDGTALPADKAAEVAKLKTRDAQVRAHEAAHLAAAGGLAQGGATYSYQRGPDGRSYAVGGEVSIDTGSVGDDPEAARAKALRVVAAALAPADPSGQDLAVASRGRELAAQAQTRAQAEARNKTRAPAGQGAGSIGRNVDLTA